MNKIMLTSIKMNVQMCIGKLRSLLLGEAVSSKGVKDTLTKRNAKVQAKIEKLNVATTKIAETQLKAVDSIRDRAVKTKESLDIALTNELDKYSDDIVKAKEAYKLALKKAGDARRKASQKAYSKKWIAVSDTAVLKSDLMDEILECEMLKDQLAR